MRIVAILTLLLLACNPTPPIQPEQFDGGSGGASSGSTTMSTTTGSTSGTGGSSSVSGGGGSGGGGAGLSCDPCQDTDGQRLVRRRTISTSPDGLRLESPAFVYDSVRQENCYATLAEDGVTRCMPIVVYTAGSYYADPTCTAPLIAASKPAPNLCLTPLKYAYSLLPGQDPCNLARRMHTVGPLYTGNVFVSSDGSCIQANNMFNAFYHVGATIPPTDFAPMTQKVE